MDVLYFVLFLIAAICFLLSAFNIVHERLNLVALGLFAWVLVLTIHAGKALD